MPSDDERRSRSPRRCRRGSSRPRQPRSCRSARIAALDGELNAFLRVARDEALAQARAIDQKRARGEALGPLAGVPIAIKDAICTRGVESTAGSKILAGYVPPYDATVVARLRAADAVLLGKTNMDEFAMGSSNENSAFGPTRNPWDLDAHAGRLVRRAAPPRSRRGWCRARSAATRAARSASPPRSPAPSASSRRTAASRATASSRSRRASTRSAPSRPTCAARRACSRSSPATTRATRRRSTRRSQDYEAACGAERRGPAHRRARRVLRRGLDPEVSRERPRGDRGPARPRAASVRAGEARRTRSSPSRPTTSSRRPRRRATSRASTASATACASTAPTRDLRAMYGATRDAGFGAEVKRRILLGTFVLSAGYYDAYYLKAQKVRTLIRRDFERGLRRGRRHLLPGVADPGVPPRREGGRPARDVPERRLHAAREPGRHPGDQRPVRAGTERPARGPADDGASARRGDDARRRGGLGGALSGPRSAAGARRAYGLTVRVVALDEATAPRVAALFEACGSACFCRYWHFEGKKNDWLERCARGRTRTATSSWRSCEAAPSKARGLLAMDGATRHRLDEARAARAAPQAAAPGSLPSARPGAGRGRLEHRLPAGAARPAAPRRRAGPRGREPGARARLGRSGGARRRGLSARRDGRRAPLHDEEAWVGTQRLFESCGFVRVAGEPAYPVMRKLLE